jgi:hypothetical protein
VKFVAAKKCLTKFFFHPSLFYLFLDPGSGMGKNQDPGSGINIPDPQHCKKLAGPTVYYTRSNEPSHAPKFELPDKTFRALSVEIRIDFCEKGDKITRFDRIIGNKITKYAI